MGRLFRKKKEWSATNREKSTIFARNEKHQIII